MIAQIVFTSNYKWMVKYAEDIYLDVYSPSTRNMDLKPNALVQYELLWCDVKCYANLLKIVDYEPLSLLSVDSATR
jgi:hypothetical protein